MSCPVAPKNNGDRRSTPALSLTETLVPASVVGKGVESAITIAVAKFTPKAATMDSGASSAPRKLAAETLATSGAIVKVCGLEIPPPGAGVTTVTPAVPAVAMSAAVMAAVSCVALTNVVVRALPFQFTVEFAVKLVPLTVKVNAPPPAAAMFGLMEIVVGAGILGLMVKVPAGDEPPPGAGF